MAHAHTALFWAHFASSVLGIVAYAALVWLFHAFSRKSFFRPTCIALCWIFTSLGALLFAHTVAQLVDRLGTVLLYVDIGTRTVIAVAVVSIATDTRRDPFGSVLGLTGARR